MPSCWSFSLLLVWFLVAAADASSYVGRFTDKGEAEWSLSEMRLVLERSSPGKPIHLDFQCSNDCSYYLDIVVNCKFSTTKTLAITPSTTVVDIDSALGGQTSDLSLLEISIIKVTETNTEGKVNGTMFLQSIDGAKSIKGSTSCQAPKAYKLLVFGDSLTCGYGVLGYDPCQFSGATENARLAWASLVARAVDAELSLVAWSGKGLVRNYGEKTSTSALPLPAFYDSTLGSMVGQPTNHWDPARYIANVVIIYLGANDYSTEPNPTDAEFINAGMSLVNKIKTDYPNASILLLTDEFPFTVKTSKATNVEKIAAMSGSKFFKIPASVIDSSRPTGCNGHPNTLTQQGIANAVTPVVQGLLNSINGQGTENIFIKRI